MPELNNECEFSSDVSRRIGMEYYILLHTKTGSLNTQAELEQTTIMNLSCSNQSSVSRPIPILYFKKFLFIHFREGGRERKKSVCFFYLFMHSVAPCVCLDVGLNL